MIPFGLFALNALMLRRHAGWFVALLGFYVILNCIHIANYEEPQGRFGFGSNIQLVLAVNTEAILITLGVFISWIVRMVRKKNVRTESAGPSADDLPDN